MLKLQKKTINDPLDEFVKLKVKTTLFMDQTCYV